MEKKSASAIVCPECGGDFSAADLLDGDSIVTCLNCNRRFYTSEILRKSSEVEAEEIRSSAYRDVERERIQAYRETEAEKTRAYRDVEEGKRRSESERLKFEYRKMKAQINAKEVRLLKKALKIVIPIVAGLLVLSLLVFSIVGLVLHGYNPNPTAIRLGISYEDFQGMQYTEASNILEDKGFTNIMLQDAGWHLLKKSGEVKQVTIDGCDEFYGFSKFLPDDLIIIYYYS